MANAGYYYANGSVVTFTVTDTSYGIVTYSREERGIIGIYHDYATEPNWEAIEERLLKELEAEKALLEADDRIQRPVEFDRNEVRHPNTPSAPKIGGVYRSGEG